MTEYTWAFDQSFLVFLAIAFVSIALAEKVRSLIPMPLIYGVLFAAGFAVNALPKDMLVSANMIAAGTIAFNVLVIHSGTMINIRMLIARKQEALLCIVSALVLVLGAGIGLMPVLGRGLAMVSPGSVIGGGASCAIASRWVLDKNPAISVFPWLIFMFQGLFSVPVVTWALKRESRRLVKDFREGKQAGSGKGPDGQAGRGAAGAPDKAGQKKPFCERIPANYKSTAYYLGIIMIVTVFNNFLSNHLLAGLNINPNLTALIFGCILGSIGLMDKAPLFKSDSYGLLILGLMGLMANTLAGYSWKELIAFLPPLLLVFVVSTALLILCGVVGAKICHFSPEHGIALTMNSMMGFPVNGMLTEQAAAVGENEAERGYIKSQIGPVLGMGTMLISNAVSIVIVSVMVIFV